MEEIVKQCDQAMVKVIENLKNGLKTIRSGVVSASVLDKIYIDYYGEKTQLKVVAGISAPLPTQLVIKPYDPSCVKAIVASIGSSDLGINPVVNAPNIILNFPPLTGERRKGFVKQAKSLTDQAKVGIRSVRTDYMNKIKKDASLSKDMVFNLQDDIQKVTDKYNKNIDEIFASKEKELMTL